VRQLWPRPGLTDSGANRRLRHAAASWVVIGFLLGIANVLNNELFPEAYVFTCVATALALVGVARAAGCTWTDLGLSREAVGRGLRWGAVITLVILACYVTVAAIPALRDVLADRRVTSLAMSAVLVKALVWVPFGTVLLEETAFRGVIYGMAQRRYGTAIATAASSLVFGLWHVLPARRIGTVNPVFASVFGTSAGGRAIAYALALIGTALAGVVLCELRRRSGSVLAPMAAHWATNSLGYLAAYVITRQA
jgi:membrane protease YdiL (CAAX protease family)